MICRAKHAPVTGVCSPPACAGDVCLDIFRSWCVPACSLYCLNCTIYKYSHGLMVRFGDDNHSNFGIGPQQSPKEFCLVISIFKMSLPRIMTKSLLRIITKTLLHIIT